ncbi:hypothetical protein V5799_022331 [Amblyomma americanum]|uniref:Uncharacterized protein n=1 Tax=Amblyomma americanum TaxID=6943 RepID=A0AAQ4FLA9_AMBAM
MAVTRQEGKNLTVCHFFYLQAWGIAPLFYPYGRMLAPRGSEASARPTYSTDPPLHLKRASHEEELLQRHETPTHVASDRSSLTA